MDVKPFQLKLRIVWFKNYLGLGIDHVSVIHQYSLTPYYFWPRTEAWEQLKLELDSKLWVTIEEKVRTLKIAGDIMNYWLSYKDTKTVENLKKDFPEVKIITILN